MSNAADRLPLLKDPANVIDVFSADDLPPAVIAPDGVSRRPLALNTRYYIHNTFVWPKCLLPVAPAPNVTFDTTDIVSARFVDVEIQIDGDDTPHFWGRDMASVHFLNLSLVDKGNAGSGHSSRLFDFVGGSGNGFSFLVVTFVTIRSFKRLGSMVDMGLFFSAMFQSDNEGGLVTRVTGITTVAHQHLFGNIFFIQVGRGTIKPQIVFQGAVPNAIFSNNNLNQDPGDAAIMVDGMFSGELDIVGNSYGGIAVGDFFRPDVSQTISSMEKKDIPIFAVEDAPGNRVNVIVDPGHGLTRDQIIRIGDSTIPAYNGFARIFKVRGDETKLEIIRDPFLGTATANVKITRVTTTIANPIVNGETVTIADTQSYDGTFLTLFAQGDFSFDIPVAFVGSEVGIVVSAGQNQKTVGVNVGASGAQPDSRALAFGEMNGNAIVTVISAPNAYQTLNVSGIVNNPVSERFTLTDAVAGIYTYNGNKPISTKITAIVNAVKVGVSDFYRFTTSVNGVIPLFGSAAYAPMEVQNDKVGVTMSRFVILVNGDTIQIIVAGDQHSDDITITDFNIQIEG